MYFYLPVPYLHTSPTAHTVTPRKKRIVVPPTSNHRYKSQVTNHRYNQVPVPVPVPYTRTTYLYLLPTLPSTCIPLKEGPCLPGNIPLRYLRYLPKGTYGCHVPDTRIRYLTEVGKSLHKETGEGVCMCVWHVGCCMVL